MKATIILTALAALVAALPGDSSEEVSSHDQEVSGYSVITLWPTLIIPIKKASPGTAFVTQYNGEVSFSEGKPESEVRTLVRFDSPSISPIPSTAKVYVKFALEPANPKRGEWKVTSNKLDIYLLSTGIGNGVTSWNNKPSRTSKAARWTVNVEDTKTGKLSVTGEPFSRKGVAELSFELVVPTQGSFDWFESKSPGPTTGIYVEVHIPN